MTRANLDHQSGPVIALDTSRVARPFAKTESLWTPELERMTGFLSDHFYSLKHHMAAISHTWQREVYDVEWHGSDHYPSKNKHRRRFERKAIRSGPLLSIALFGSNGSGKSSLLKTFARKHRTGTQNDHGRPLTVFSLPVIEPSLMDHDEHFLYTVIARIWELLERHRDPLQASEIMSPAERAFQRVVENMRVVDKCTNEEADALGVSLQRLERHRSGSVLRDKLADLIEKLSQEMCQDSTADPPLILLPVDDADVSFERLLTILDTLRSYLCHPQLVPVFTFTSMLAEELLCSHYAQALRFNKDKRLSVDGAMHSKLDETFSQERMTRTLSSQFLARLFPLKHRVRIRVGGLRARSAHYRRIDNSTSPHQEQQASPNERELTSRPVKKLLEESCRFVFGPPHPQLGIPVKNALAPSTLRRQLQLLDVLAGVEGRLRSHSAQELIVERWADAFDDICWAVFSIHRDVLVQLRLHQEDLYGWTRQGLRPLVLSAQMGLPAPTRRRFVEHWRHGSSDRHSQVLSLLAAYVYRPPMPGCDDYAPLGGAVATAGSDRQDLDVAIAAIWFLNVWFGFYLPQIVSLSSADDSEAKNDASGELADTQHASGWLLENGARHTTVVALRQPKRAIEGLVFMEIESMTEIQANFENNQDNDTLLLLLAVWCQWGIDSSGRPWAAINLWRALGLLGQLLLCAMPWKHDGTEEARKTRREQVRKKVLLQLEQHWRNAWEPKIMNHDQSECTEIPSHQFTETCRIMDMQWQGRRLDNAMGKLAERLTRWVLKWSGLSEPTAQNDKHGDDENPVVPFQLDWGFQDMAHSESQSVDQSDNQSVQYSLDYSQSVIRRLHGEYLIGDLWVALNRLEANALANGGVELGKHMRGWHASLLGYWNGGATRSTGKSCPTGSVKQMAAMFADCPLLPEDKQYGHLVMKYPVYATREQVSPERVSSTASASATRADD